MIGAIPKRVKSYLEMGVFVEEEERRPEAAPATEVFSLLNKLNKSKATGLDKIRLIRECADLICIPICDIFNQSISSRGASGQERSEFIILSRAQKLQNRATRIITFQGYDVRSAQIRKQLNWEELASRRQRHLSLLMYDSVNGNIPSYLSDLSSNVCENNPYKSMPRNTEYNIVLDHVPKTECYKGSFSYRGGML